MGALTVTASMKDWHNSGWVISASHILAVLETPPPPPTALGELMERPDEVYHELLEDLALAKQASEEYKAKGVDNTIPYSEYRTQRLGTDS